MKTATWKALGELLLFAILTIVLFPISIPAIIIGWRNERRKSPFLGR